MSLDSPAAAEVDGSRLSIGIVAARFNARLVDGLLARVQSKLLSAGVKRKRIVLVRVPGSHEVPYAANELARSGKYECVIALGVLIGGDTNHHEMVGDSVSHALQTVSMTTRTPIINGVIVANTLAQAEARCIGKIDRGAEFANASLEMAALKKTFSR